MYISIDKRGCLSKPNKEETGKISRRIAAHHIPVNKLRDIAERISYKGYTWCPAIFHGSRRISNFISAQFIALDFDGGVSFEAISERAKKYMLPILFAYETFSSVNMNKFRIVFMLEKPIGDINTFNIIIAVFMKIFNECDTACKDASRMFFGGKRLIYYNDNEIGIDIKNLFMNFQLYLRDTYGKTHYKAHWRKFISKYISNDGKNLPFIVNRIKGNGNKLPKCHKSYRSDTIEKLYDKCRLYREFADDSEWLYYNQLFGIATNLIHVDKGRRIFSGIIEQSQYDTYKREWGFYLKYFQDNDYLPMRCEHFCPYCGSCPHGNNMLDSVKIKRKEIIRIQNPEYINIEAAQSELRTAFFDAMNSTDAKIHVIKAQTAIGKTHIYLEYLKNTDKPCIIAVPTNKLKHEVYGECAANGINAIETPSVCELANDIPTSVYEHIEHLYSTGRHKSVMAYIKSEAQDIPALKEFANASEAVKGFNGHIITTHHKLLYASETWLKKYNVIVDEDILKTMTKNQLSIDISDIEDILTKSLPERVRTHLLNIIELSGENNLFSISPLGDCRVSASFNLNALLNADKFYSDGKSVVFYQTPELKDIKYTILSATADEYIYTKYFGSERVCFCTCGIAEYKGRLLQYFDNTYSRRFIAKNDGIYEKIQDITGDCPKITFKKYDDSENGIHFGNSEGCNCMKGQNIAVIGTPHMAEFLYRLLAYQMGYDSNDELRYREVTHNGYKFWFYTYDNELMRRIQFWMIESELEQSVGRARLLRENCTVWLFSDFPLVQSELAI